MEVRQLPVGAGWRPGYLEMQGWIQGLIPLGNSKIFGAKWNDVPTTL